MLDPAASRRFRLYHLAPILALLGAFAVGQAIEDDPTDCQGGLRGDSPRNPFCISGLSTGGQIALGSLGAVLLLSAIALGVVWWRAARAGKS